MMTQAQQHGELNFDLRTLKLERLSRNLSANDMGRALGISANGYYKKERGESNISVSDLAKILDLFELAPEEAGRFFINR